MLDISDSGLSEAGTVDAFLTGQFASVESFSRVDADPSEISTLSDGDADKTCTEGCSCLECVGPFVSRTGGRGAQSVLDALIGRKEAEDKMWKTLPKQYKREKYWKEAVKGLIRFLEWDYLAKSEEELDEHMVEWASNNVPFDSEEQWEQFAYLELWLDEDAMWNTSVSTDDVTAVARMALWWSHYSLACHVEACLSPWLIQDQGDNWGKML